MKKHFVVMSIVIMALVLLVSCLIDPDEETLFNGFADTAKINLHHENPQRVIHTAWLEQGVDPRALTGYRLLDGTPLYDHFVQMYGMRLTYNNCAVDSTRKYCDLTDLHICMPMDIIYERIFKNYDTIVSPVRERGHKWLLHLLPQQVPVGLLYRWPMEHTHPWTELTGEERYPYDEDAVAVIIEQLVQIHQDFPFDGIAYNEDYFDLPVWPRPENSLSPYPIEMYYPGVDITLAWRTGGENLLRFAHELNAAMYGADYDKWSAEHEGLSSLPRNRLIQELREVQYSAQVPESFTYPADHHAFPGLTVYREDIFDISFSANYGGYGVPNSLNPGFPRARYGLFSIDLGLSSGITIPPHGWNAAGSYLLGRMESHLYGNYGALMYYHVRDWPNPLFFGEDELVDHYYSVITDILHGTKVRFDEGAR